MTKPKQIRSLLSTLHPIKSNRELIRLGPKGDGGYLVPDDFEGIEACFSPGVSTISGFEKDCADRDIKVFLADLSVDKPADDHNLFHFTKKYIGVTSNTDFMTLDSWVGNSGVKNDSDLLLQMDIEGFEYEVFLAASEALMNRFRIIVVEFHELDQLWSVPFYKLAARVFEKILQSHSCLHIHPNNYYSNFRKSGIDIPPLLEFTFLRNDRISERAYQKVFPNPLDSDNTTNPSLPLPRFWYRD